MLLRTGMRCAVPHLLAAHQLQRDSQAQLGRVATQQGHCFSCRAASKALAATLPAAAAAAGVALAAMLWEAAAASAAAAAAAVAAAWWALAVRMPCNRACRLSALACVAWEARRVGCCDRCVWVLVSLGWTAQYTPACPASSLAGGLILDSPLVEASLNVFLCLAHSAPVFLPVFPPLQRVDDRQTLTKVNLTSTLPSAHPCCFL